jgi:hypothetical protein
MNIVKRVLTGTRKQIIENAKISKVSEKTVLNWTQRGIVPGLLNFNRYLTATNSTLVIVKTGTTEEVNVSIDHLKRDSTTIIKQAYALAEGIVDSVSIVSGLDKNTACTWYNKGNNPNVLNLQAHLNAMGYDLHVKAL